MNREDYENLDTILAGTCEQKKNAVEMMIGFLTTPMAKRKGVSMDAESCAVWAEELRLFLKSLGAAEGGRPL